MFNLTFGFYYGRQSDRTLYFSNEFSYFFNRIKVYWLYLKKKSALHPKVTTYNHWYMCQLVFFLFKYFKNVYVILTMYFIFFYCTLKIKYHNTFNIVNEFYYSIFRRFFYHSQWRKLLHWWKLKYTTKGGRQ